MPTPAMPTPAMPIPAATTYIVVSTSPADNLYPERRGSDASAGGAFGPFVTPDVARQFVADHLSSWALLPTIIALYDPLVTELYPLPHAYPLIDIDDIDITEGSI